MKRKLAIIATVIVLLSLIVYAIPIFVSMSKSRPLYENFDIGSKCMGGHEIFLYLDDDKVFTHCPGHREMSPLGRIERSEDSVTVYPLGVDEPFFRIDFDGSDHTFVGLNEDSVTELPQVNNPWRTWLPRFFPEE
jgi:hypothetical protein